MFAATQERDVGVLVMFAVREALASSDGIRRVVQGLIESGHLDPSLVDHDDPLGFLVDDGATASVVEAAYRFARHEPGCHVVLSGTGSLDHLAENVASINGGPLPGASLARLDQLFGHIDSISGD